MSENVREFDALEGLSQCFQQLTVKTPGHRRTSTDIHGRLLDIDGQEEACGGQGRTLTTEPDSLAVAGSDGSWFGLGGCNGPYNRSLSRLRLRLDADALALSAAFRRLLVRPALLGLVYGS